MDIETDKGRNASAAHHHHYQHHNRPALMINSLKHKCETKKAVEYTVL